MATDTIKFEVPADVVQEFAESLEDDMVKWAPAVHARMAAYKEPVAKQAHGTMIALFPPDELLFDLAVDGGEEPVDLHVTVLYLGKDLTETQLEMVGVACKKVSEKYAPLNGSIGGAGRFPASPSSDGKDVLIRLVNIPRLEALREELIRSLRVLGIEPVLNNGYTPHMTLAYIDSEAEGTCVHPEPIEFTADALWVCTGDLREEYKFSGEAIVKEHRPTEFTTKIAKVDMDRQMVFGWVTVAEEAGKSVVDKQGDVISEDEMEKMAYDFVSNCRRVGEMHRRAEGIGKLVESMVFTKEKQKSIGVDLGKSAWWCGFKIEDSEVWKKVKSGDYTAFSIHGKGVRQKLNE